MSIVKVSGDLRFVVYIWYFGWNQLEINCPPWNLWHLIFGLVLIDFRAIGDTFGCFRVSLLAKIIHRPPIINQSVLSRSLSSLLIQRTVTLNFDSALTLSAVSLAKVCRNIPADLNRLVFGVDITSWQCCHLILRTPMIMRITCDQSKLWKNPYGQ